MMSTPTCPRHTSVSETIKDVSWTGCIFINVNSYINTCRCLFFQIVHRSPSAPIGSISSMEVNVDLLDQMELIDISDQEALDVFFSSGEEGVLASPLPGKKSRNCNRDRKTNGTFLKICSIRLAAQGHNNSEGVISNGLFRHVLEGLEAKSRMSSTSSSSSSDSQTINTNGGDTPVVRSDDEAAHTGTVKRRAPPSETEKGKSQTTSSPS